MTDYNSEEFWKGAPEGATHWGNGEGGYVEAWYRKFGDDWFFTTKNNEWHWVYTEMSREREIYLVPRPAPPWSGDGLPPVGTVCEIKRASFPSWEKVKILCIGVHRVFFHDDQGTEQSRFYREMEFRPIRTQAQIESEGRDAAIDEMSGWAGVTGLDMDRERRILGRLYDAGYRLVKP